jgi:pimeloyl-ACP methyl ester carboxylesterase
VSLNVVRSGEGPAVVLLHGLTATHRYVVMGSKTLERAGHDVIAYDARGHGESDSATPYDYEQLAVDLRAVLDQAGVDRAVLAGASMGAHTALRLALLEPERVAGLVIVTPGYDPDTYDDAATLARWDALSAGLRAGGVAGFVEAYGPPSAAEQWNETLSRVLRQRMQAHAHPDAVADALEQIPRSRPFASISELAAIERPAVVVGSRDEPDPSHPLATAKAYAQALGSELIVEEPGQSPIAWRGGQLSKLIAAMAARTR